MSRVILRRNDRSVFREVGFEDGYAKRVKRETFPSDEARAGYLQGYRLGDAARKRER